MQNANVRVGELRNGAGLALKSLPQLRILGKMIGEDLDCDIPVQPRVAGAINFAHSASANGCDEFIWAQT